MIDLNAPPIEMASEGLVLGKYGDEKEPSLMAAETLHQFTLYNESAGESSAVGVRLYSLDINKPLPSYITKCTVSLGQVPRKIVSNILTSNFERLVLRTDICIVTMHMTNLEQISYTEEDAGTCSLILDVSLPNIVKLDLGA